MLPPKIKKTWKLQKCVTVPVVLEDTWVPEDPVGLCLLNHLAHLLSGTTWPSCSCTLSRLHSPAWHPNNLQLLQSIPHSPSCFTSFTATKKALVRCVAVYVQHVLCVYIISSGRAYCVDSGRSCNSINKLWPPQGAYAMCAYSRKENSQHCPSYGLVHPLQCIYLN